LEEHVQYTLGHSLGEFAALKTSGMLKFADAVKLVRVRGEAMAKAVADFGKETAMYALVVEKGRSGILIDEIEQFAEEFANEGEVVAVANHNSVTEFQKITNAVLSSCDFGDKGGVAEMYGSFALVFRA